MADAVIIPFPLRPPSSSDQDRLRIALAELQVALDLQKRALSDWRFAMTELGIGVAGLEHALGGYQNSLVGVQASLGVLRNDAQGLECLADGALRQHGTGPA